MQFSHSRLLAEAVSLPHTVVCTTYFEPLYSHPRSARRPTQSDLYIDRVRTRYCRRRNMKVTSCARRRYARAGIQLFEAA